MSQAPPRPTLEQQLQGCLIRDRFSLAKLASNPSQAKQFEKRKARSEAAVQARLSAMPDIRYPEILPVVARLEDLKAAIGQHQVVIVAGETGSGKTTTLNCLGMFIPWVLGTIGHTQPRRVAARTVAARLAEELAVPMGEQVGFQIRFGDQTSDRNID